MGGRVPLCIHLCILPLVLCGAIDVNRAWGVRYCLQVPWLLAWRYSRVCFPRWRKLPFRLVWLLCEGMHVYFCPADVHPRRGARVRNFPMGPAILGASAGDARSNNVTRFLLEYLVTSPIFRYCTFLAAATKIPRIACTCVLLFLQT